jgi:hypothetical protein
VRPVRKGPLDQPVRRARKDLQVLSVHKVPTARRARRDLPARKGPKVPPVRKDLMDPQAQLDQSGRLALKDRSDR